MSDDNTSAPATAVADASLPVLTDIILAGAEDTDLPVLELHDAVPPAIQDATESDPAVVAHLVEALQQLGQTFGPLLEDTLSHPLHRAIEETTAAMKRQIHDHLQTLLPVIQAAMAQKKDQTP